MEYAACAESRNGAEKQDDIAAAGQVGWRGYFRPFFLDIHARSSTLY
jgi:hypothetical protein